MPNASFGLASLDTRFVCLRCLLRLSDRSPASFRRYFRSSVPGKDSTVIKETSIYQQYFSANARLPSKTRLHRSTLGSHTFYDGLVRVLRGRPSPLESPPSATAIEWREEHPKHKSPHDHRHRRRKRLIGESASAIEQLPLISNDTAVSQSSPESSVRPVRRLLAACFSLAKPRLSFLIVLTTTAAYSLYPVPALFASSTTSSPSLSAMTLVLLTTGTALCSASANALNMMLEPEHDAKMSRTQSRPIVRGLIGKKEALIFASVAGFLGTGSLWFGVNPTVAFLGALNIGLYAGVYTPLKRISAVNTWIGALVGGIPPLMGWAAAAGQNASGDGGWHELLFTESSIGGWLLAGLLYAWQFPHFNGLSWTIREEYKHAGHRMLAWTNPRMNGRVAFRYAVLLFPICAGLWWFQITDQGFLVTSSIVNAWIVRQAWRFWRREGQQGSARGLFWASIWHLPVIMVLAMLHKKGLWEGVWHPTYGQRSDRGYQWEAEEESACLDDRLRLARELSSSDASLKPAV